MSNFLKTKQDKIKVYLSSHHKTQIFLEYFSSIIVTLFAAFLFALSYKIFQSPEVPNSLPLISGGTAGIARTIALLCNMFGGDPRNTTLIYSISYAIINIPIIFLAFRYIGVRFAIFTTINVVMTSVFTTFIDLDFFNELATHIACVVPTDIGGQQIYLQAGLLARAFMAGVLCGFASSISISCGGSAGGVDTVSYFFSMRKSSNIGKYVIVINSVVFLLFASLNAVNDCLNHVPYVTAVTNAIVILLFVTIYSFIVSLVIDVITRNNKKEQIQIITKMENLSKLLLANIPHGATIMHSKGAFTGEDHIVIYVIVSTFETKGVISLVRKADPNSFINVISVKQVYGRFRKPKIK